MGAQSGETNILPKARGPTWYTSSLAQRVRWSWRAQATSLREDKLVQLGASPSLVSVIMNAQLSSILRRAKVFSCIDAKPELSYPVDNLGHKMLDSLRGIDVRRHPFLGKDPVDLGALFLAQPPLDGSHVLFQPGRQLRRLRCTL